MYQLEKLKVCFIKNMEHQKICLFKNIKRTTHLMNFAIGLFSTSISRCIKEWNNITNR